MPSASWLTQQGSSADDVLAGKGLAQAAERFKVEQLLIVAFTPRAETSVQDVRLFHSCPRSIRS